MASEDPVQEEQPATSKKAPVELFKIHSMVRKVATRLQRMQASTHHRFVQRFGGGLITVRRARPATVSKDVLLRFLPELQKAVEEGKIIVRTPSGLEVNLITLQVVGEAKMPAPKPNPPADSAANDVTFPGGVGQKIEQFEGGGGVDDKPPLS